MTGDARRGVRAVSVGPASVDESGSVRRVTAVVDGVPVWFESRDLALAPVAEAWGCAFLIPALHARARLRLADPVDPEWVANLREVTAILHRWWRYPAWEPEVPSPFPLGGGDSPGDASPATGDRIAAGPGGPVDGAAPTGLFFSGGVDSFHRLLRGTARVDWLVTIQGFDFALDDQRRADAVEASVRRIAAATGTRAAVVRTNARDHPLVRGMSWERAHGGVLAGVGHLLAPAVTRVLMSASAPGDREIPWGQHWQLDPLWSSRRTTLVHDGRGLRRIDKLRAIAAEPLVREHLRVCWRNLAPVGNCSRCPKCLLAMLILEERRELAHSVVFEGRDQLADRIAALRRTRDRWHSFDELARSPALGPALAAATRGLVRRSRHDARPGVRIRRAVVAWLLARTRRA